MNNHELKFGYQRTNIKYFLCFRVLDGVVVGDNLSSKYPEYKRELYLWGFNNLEFNFINNSQSSAGIINFKKYSPEYVFCFITSLDPYNLKIKDLKLITQLLMNG
jgi:hypothetical protein